MRIIQSKRGEKEKEERGDKKKWRKIHGFNNNVEDVWCLSTIL